MWSLQAEAPSLSHNRVLWPSLDNDVRRRERKCRTLKVEVTHRGSLGSEIHRDELGPLGVSAICRAVQVVMAVHDVNGCGWAALLNRDNRFWLQILPCGGESASHDVVEVAARFFSKADKAALKRTLDKEELRELRKALDVVPGDLRFTLLALVVRSKSSNGSTVEKLVALPSLGWSVRGWSRRSHATQSAVNAVWQYDIRYRSFDASLRTTSTPPQ